MLESFEELLQLAEVAHGHLCAGQILGVRMALLACRRLEVNDPRGAERKKLVTLISRSLASRSSSAASPVSLAT